MIKIRFFHGRTDPDQQMDDWGLNGPTIRCESVRWTYGEVRLEGVANPDDMRVHFPEAEGPGYARLDRYTVRLIPEGDCLRIGDVFYGDFDLTTETDR